MSQRFLRAVKQKNKVRPIDFYKASMVNHLVTQSEGVAVRIVDHVASMLDESKPQQAVAQT